MSVLSPERPLSGTGSPRVISRESSQWERAIQDLTEGLRRWPLWGTLAWNDIRQRYRRSLIGPFWITLSMGAMVGGLGFLYAGLFRQRIGDYLPYVSVGLIVWGFLSGMISDGCIAFTGGDGLIRQLPVPLSVQAYRIVCRNLIIFGHNMLIYAIVALSFGVWAGWGLVAAAGGLAVLIVNGVWLALLLGVVSARFRDIPPIVATGIQVIFLMTPIFWRPELLPERTALVDANPLYHLLEVVRAPLLGHAVPAGSWVAVALTTVVGWTLTLTFLIRYRWRVAYWV